MKSQFPNHEKILLIGGCGYIGSFLYEKLCSAGFHVTICDYLVRGNPLNADVLQCDYAELEAPMLRDFGIVLWFAGHSSVGQAMENPKGALINNCFNLFNLSQKLHPDTNLVYASTGSIYSSSNHDIQPSSEITKIEVPSQNAYDISKFSFDYIAKNFLENFHAIRMGTLAGFSPNIREELVFNAMNISAFKTGKVYLSNANSFRTILFLDDLWSLIHKLITTKQLPGILNAGSLTLSLGELATKIAGVWGADIINYGDTKTYSFKLETSRMSAICDETNHRPEMAERCHALIDDMHCGNFLRSEANHVQL